MKILIPPLCLLCVLCVDSFAQRSDARAILNERPDLAQKYFPDRVNGRSKSSQFTRDPIRLIERDGEILTCNLAPLFAWSRARRGANPMPAWSAMSVRAVNSDADGLLATFINNPDETIFIHNYPRTVADGTHVHCYALPDGHFTFTDQFGIRHTVRAWNYGTLPDSKTTVGARSTRAPNLKTNTPPAADKNAIIMAKESPIERPAKTVAPKKKPSAPKTPKP